MSLNPSQSRTAYRIEDTKHQRMTDISPEPGHFEGAAFLLELADHFGGCELSLQVKPSETEPARCRLTPRDSAGSIPSSLVIDEFALPAGLRWLFDRRSLASLPLLRIFSRWLMLRTGF